MYNIQCIMNADCTLLIVHFKLKKFCVGGKIKDRPSTFAQTVGL